MRPHFPGLDQIIQAKIAIGSQVQSLRLGLVAEKACQSFRKAEDPLSTELHTTRGAGARVKLPLPVPCPSPWSGAVVRAFGSPFGGRPEPRLRSVVNWRFLCCFLHFHFYLNFFLLGICPPCRPYITSTGTMFGLLERGRRRCLGLFLSTLCFLFGPGFQFSPCSVTGAVRPGNVLGP